MLSAISIQLSANNIKRQILGRKLIADLPLPFQQAAEGSTGLFTIYG
jgi:hypothetical protein